MLRKSKQSKKHGWRMSDGIGPENREGIEEKLKDQSEWVMKVARETRNPTPLLPSDSQGAT